MSDPIHINSDFGRVAYEAWVSEFCDYPWDTWEDLNGITKEAWEEVAYTVLENRVVLPPTGVEISFRTNRGTISYAFAGLPDQAMKDDLISTLWLYMTGQEQ